MASQTTQELKKVLSFPFEDERWVNKLLITCLLVILSFIPVLPYVLLLGYMALIILKVVEEDELVLPEWSDMSELFNHGLRLFGVGFVYTLPIFGMIIVGYLAMIMPIFTMVSEVMAEGVGVALVILGYIAGFGLIGIGVLLSFAIGIVLPVAGCHAVVERDFSAGFRFKEWWKIFKANWDGFLIAFLLIFGGSMVAYYISQFFVLTVVLCCLYPFLLIALSAYMMIVGSAFFAQAYRQGREAVQSAE